jgi:hypothetical protein
MAELADQHHTAPSTILRLTAEDSPKGRTRPQHGQLHQRGVQGQHQPRLTHDPLGCISTCFLDPLLAAVTRKAGWPCRSPGYPLPYHEYTDQNLDLGRYRDSPP